ncbi:hypothetical protein E4T17_21845 [Vibrio vulnificus]|nr:hypothetical protein [Vibrio vulnificus]
MTEHHIKRAIDHLDAVEEAFQQGYKDGFNAGYADVAKDIIALEAKLKSVKEQAIRTAVGEGERTLDIAESYSMSSARISQIAPRKRSGK